MDISTSGNVVTIRGNIKTVSDYQKIKSTIDTLARTHSSIVIDILDSISITSSVIGYFTKLVQKDKIDLSIKVGDPDLMELFEDLGLVSLFKVRKV
jgi:anti-anti-sigma regulatory factor